MTTSQARSEFDSMVSKMQAAGVDSSKIDDLRLVFEFAINPHFRKTVSDMVAKANGL